MEGCDTSLTQKIAQLIELGGSKFKKQTIKQAWAKNIVAILPVLCWQHNQ